MWCWQESQRSWEGAQELILDKEGARVTFTLPALQPVLMFLWRISCDSRTTGEGLRLTWQRPPGNLTVFERTYKTTYQRKKQLELESPITTEMNLYAEGILVAIQPKSKVPFIASGMDGQLFQPLGICRNRKFYCLSLFLFRTTLITKFFTSKQTSVIYKVPLCFCFRPLKLHRVNLILLLYNSAEI